MAIDGMWQVFKLQRSTPRNDFCRIAAKNGILLRLINTLYSLNEAARLASASGGGGFPPDGLAPRPRSGPLDPGNSSFMQTEMPPYGTDQPDMLKIKNGERVLPAGMQEPSRTSASHSPDSPFFRQDFERPRSSNATVEASGPSRLPDGTSVSRDRESLDRYKNDLSRAEIDFRQQRGGNTSRISTDRASYGFPASTATPQENVRPLLSLLEKEPPSRHFSGQLEYVHNLPGLEKHESILPLLHASNEKKTNGLDFLMAEFAGNDSAACFICCLCFLNCKLSCLLLEFGKN